MAESEKRAQQELEDRERELTEKVANATLEQLVLKIDADLETLKKLAPSPEKDAMEASLDCKWLRETTDTHLCLVGSFEFVLDYLHIKLFDAHFNLMYVCDRTCC